MYTPGISERRGTTTTFLHGGLKNVDAQSRPTQALSATRTYDAFGNATASSGTWRGPFGYGGYGYQEDATGLRLLGHRFYDPSIGRFLTRDPVKDGRNWYVYCDNDPVNGADPLGLFSQDKGGKDGDKKEKVKPPKPAPFVVPIDGFLVVIIQPNPEGNPFIGVGGQKKFGPWKIGIGYVDQNGGYVSIENGGKNEPRPYIKFGGGKAEVGIKFEE